MRSSSGEIVHSPNPAIWQPLTLLRRMGAEAWRFRELTRRLVVRDLRAQYRQSLLGYFWAFVPPLVMALGCTLARDAQVLNIADTQIPYPAFVMMGMVLWQTFIESLNGPIQAYNSFKTVISRIYLPPETIILAKLGEIAVNLSIKLFLLVGIFITYRIPVNLLSLWAPLVLILLMLEGAAIGLFLAPIAALYHDVPKGLTVATDFLFFLTPVVYPVPLEGAFGIIVKLNPATPLLVAARELATGSAVPNALAVAAVGLFSLLAFLVGLIAFRVSIPFVVERSGS